MKKIVYKYPINLGANEIMLKRYAEPRCVQVQNGQPCLWVEVDLDQNMEILNYFHLVGTGHELPSLSLKYIGTIQQPPFVWHLYQENRLQ